jgi:hypothetical protein
VDEVLDSKESENNIFLNARPVGDGTFFKNPKDSQIGELTQS